MEGIRMRSRVYCYREGKTAVGGKEERLICLNLLELMRV